MPIHVYTSRDVSTPSVIVDTRSKLLLKDCQCASSVVSCSMVDRDADFKLVIFSSKDINSSHIWIAMLPALRLCIHQHSYYINEGSKPP